MKKKKNIATLITIVLLACAPGVQAFKIVTCDGAKLKWPGNGNNAKFTRNKCSVANDSSQANAYFSAINRWNQVGGMWDKLEAAFTWPSDHCFMEFDDGENDFALVDAGQMTATSEVLWSSATVRKFSKSTSLWQTSTRRVSAIQTKLSRLDPAPTRAASQCFTSLVMDSDFQ